MFNYYPTYKQVERLKLSTSEQILRITNELKKKFIDGNSYCLAPAWKPLPDFEQYLLIYILPAFQLPSQTQRGPR